METVRIGMRDGVYLHTEIYRPHDQEGPLPVIMDRTPYGLNHTENGYSGKLRKYPELVEEGYIIVFQDTRGRGASDGEFVTLGPVRDRSTPDSTDESTDTYDTIEWLVDNLDGFNGRVGILGISYGGFLTTRALIDPHPALRAASPQATCADMFIGDDWHHNGAFRLWYAFGWISSMETDLGASRAMPGFYDAYEAFMALGPLSNVNKLLFHGRAESWNAFAEHPNLDDYWIYDMCGVLPHIQPVTVPTLNVTGWYDAEDFYGPIEVYKKYESTDKNDLNYLVLGPWHHGGWTFDKTGRGLGAIDFGSNTAE
ncbi:MAG: CocE/NonD family hydrolase, partial [Proteobacteria bacterium]|nr:CocE/NonD family hydrolase [Pseudomonadota bacterium]